MNVYTPEGNINLSKDITGINVMKIFVEEEYGYRYWLWTPEEKTMQEVEEMFNEKRRDSVQWGRVYFHDLSKFGGDWEELKIQDSDIEDDDHIDEILNPDNYDGMASIRYDPDDSRIMWNNYDAQA